MKAQSRSGRICGIPVLLFGMALFFSGSTYAVKEGQAESSGAGNRTRILFLGSSLTCANNLPQTIADLAKSRHLKMEYEMVTPSGCTLSKHAVDPVVLEKIKKGTWDFVVLQEQSRMPTLPEAALQREVYPYAEKLSSLIKMANPHARVVFYQTMAKENGQSFNVNGQIVEISYERMQEQVNATYGVMARENEGVVAPVGLAWKLVRSRNPSIALYADDIHPNATGTYLAACVFYGVFFHQSPLGLPHSSLSDSVAEFLQKAAEDGVRQAGN